LSDPTLGTINYFLDQAKSYGDILADFSYNNFHTIDAAQSDVLECILLSYERFIDQYEDKIYYLRNAVDRAFTEYYNQITYQIEDAVTLTYNEIVDTENYLTALIASIDAVSMQVLYDELDVLDAELTAVTDAIVLEQTEQNTGLWAEIERAAGVVYDYATTQITALTNTVSAWVDELWTYVNSIMDWLITTFNEFYTQIVDWVGDTLSSIGARITSEVNALMGHILDYYDRAESLVNTAKAWLVSEIGRLGNTLRGLIDAAIFEVKDLLSDLALLTDWRFLFFNLSLSFPELGFLQVLNRDEETFNRFKPYWQALFARVMEEE